LSFLEKCIDSIVDGGVVDTIYFDKAFDTVPHRRLLSKLAKVGLLRYQRKYFSMDKIIVPWKSFTKL